MKFTISREAFLQPLNLVAGVVERRHTMAVLANVLIRLQGDLLFLRGTDTEVELEGRVALDQAGVNGEITVPARKLLDICKSLPEHSDLHFSVDQQRVVIRSGRSRFTLATLPAGEFPSIDNDVDGDVFSISERDLKRLLEETQFAMAQQDVRYFLNGMLWEVSESGFRVVATDGHRLAMATLELATSARDRQVIVPRKGVIELIRLLNDSEQDVAILLGDSHIKAQAGQFMFTSKLVDGKYPDYQRVLPRNIATEAQLNRETFKSALSRAAILSNEQFRGVRLRFSREELQISANNPNQEEAEETVAIEFASDEPLEIGFNAVYMVDALSAIAGENIKLSFADANTSVLIEDAASIEALYVVMPMKL